MFPHRVCLGADSNLLIAHVVFDVSIFVAYMMISACLVYFYKRTAVFRPVWVTLAFATFIFSCGLTHVMDVLVLWFPVYYLQAAVKALCAASSLATAAAMPQVVLSMLALHKTGGELRSAN